MENEPTLSQGCSGAAQSLFWSKERQSLAWSLQWKELKIDIPPHYLFCCYQFLTFLWINCCFYETGQSLWCSCAHHKAGVSVARSDGKENLFLMLLGKEFCPGTCLLQWGLPCIQLSWASGRPWTLSNKPFWNYFLFSDRCLNFFYFFIF